MVRFFRSICIVCYLVMLAAFAAHANSTITTISVDDLAKYQREGVMLIDVRREDEWRATGVITGSHLITAFDADGRLNPDFIPSVVRIADSTKPVALICRSGRRSALAARLLTEHAGFTEAWSVDGGIKAWARSNRPVSPCLSC